jgi:hypothetical protein
MNILILAIFTIMTIIGVVNANTFSEEELISRAKEILDKKINLGIADEGNCLAEDFKFFGAVVGPLNKKDYLKAIHYGYKQLDEALEMNEKIFGFHGDPEFPNRVWFMTRQTALHNKGPLNGAKPTGKMLVLPPQSMYLEFDDDLRVREYGLYTADRNHGNTGGLGGLLGYYYGVGKPVPYPEGKPFKPSLAFSLFNFLGKIAVGISSKSDGLEVSNEREL